MSGDVTAAFAVDGVDIHVEGDGAETILMIHGWPDTHRLWDGSVQFLKHRYRCVRFTLPGFGEGDERKGWSLDEMSTLIRRIVERAAPDRRVTLLLHDWGCVFGYAFQQRHPGMVSRIIGVDVGDGVALTRALPASHKAAIFGYQLWLAAAWMVGGRIGDAMTRRMARALRCPSPPERIGSRMCYPYFMFWFGGARSYRRHIRPFLPACPMLFIYAGRNPIRFFAESWADALRRTPGNEVVGFDAGHWVMTQQPERFNQVVGDWLARQDALKPAAAA